MPFQRGINNIPSEFDKLANLTEIDLSYNKLTRVPEPVYRLENLKRANFSHNEISEMSSLTGKRNVENIANLGRSVRVHQM